MDAILSAVNQIELNEQASCWSVVDQQLAVKLG
jgi:hypothetical protein